MINETMDYFKNAMWADRDYFLNQVSICFCYYIKVCLTDAPSFMRCLKNDSVISMAPCTMGALAFHHFCITVMLYLSLLFFDSVGACTEYKFYFE